MISFYMTSRAKRYHKILYSMVYILYYVYVLCGKNKNENYIFIWHLTIYY